MKYISVEAFEHLSAEARALAANTAIIQTQEGRHLLNLITRLSEAMSGNPVTPPIGEKRHDDRQV